MPEPLAPSPVGSVQDVIEKMRAIDAALAVTDGVKWFNYLYLAVTQRIQSVLQQPQQPFLDPDWISRLDVQFCEPLFFRKRLDRFLVEAPRPAHRLGGRFLKLATARESQGFNLHWRG